MKKEANTTCDTQKCKKENKEKTQISRIFPGHQVAACLGA